MVQLTSAHDYCKTTALNMQSFVMSLLFFFFSSVKVAAPYCLSSSDPRVAVGSLCVASGIVNPLLACCSTGLDGGNGLRSSVEGELVLPFHRCGGTRPHFPSGGGAQTPWRLVLTWTLKPTFYFNSL